jgi:hypothetical protein
LRQGGDEQLRFSRPDGAARRSRGGSRSRSDEGSARGPCRAPVRFGRLVCTRRLLGVAADRKRRRCNASDPARVQLPGHDDRRHVADRHHCGHDALADPDSGDDCHRNGERAGDIDRSRSRTGPEAGAGRCRISWSDDGGSIDGRDSDDGRTAERAACGESSGIGLSGRLAGDHLAADTSARATGHAPASSADDGSPLDEGRVTGRAGRSRTGADAAAGSGRPGCGHRADPGCIPVAARGRRDGGWNRPACRRSRAARRDPPRPPRRLGDVRDRAPAQRRRRRLLRATGRTKA